MNNALHFSTGKDNWGTPITLFTEYHHHYHYVLDAAADAENHLVDWWFGPGSTTPDALVVPWPLERGNIWLNPPYSRGLQYKFVAKAITEMKRYHALQVESHLELPTRVITCLLPARTDTRLFHDLLYDADREKCRYPVMSMRYLKGRLKFTRAKHGAPFPSVIVTLS